MRMHPFPLPVRALAAALMALQAACGGWRAAKVAPQDYFATHQPETVRVTTADGRRVTLHAPAIRADSLTGMERPPGHPEPIPVAVPLEDVIQIETASGPSTLLVLGGITLLVVAVAAATSGPMVDFEGGSGSSEGFNLGSCPVIDSWDGADWRIDSGTYSGAIAAGLARAEVDNLEYARPEHGLLRLRVRTEPGETDHIDAIEVLAVTHAPDVRPVPDADGRIHAVGALAAPRRATDDRGRDAMAQLAERDFRAWESVPTDRDTARLADIRSWLDLTFVRPAGATTARLVLDAVTTPWAAWLNRELIALNGAATGEWYRMMDLPLAAAAFTATRTREAWLSASVRTRAGWVRQGMYSEAGGEVGREQVAALDLSAVAGDTVVVRLESAPSFWLVDYAGMDFGPEAPVAVTAVPPERAVAHDGRDVLSRVARADRTELVQETGDWAELTFAVPVTDGAVRVSYLVRTTGWYHIHTAQVGEPQTALLARLATEPWAISRLSTMRLNEALTRMEERTAP